MQLNDTAKRVFPQLPVIGLLLMIATMSVAASDEARAAPERGTVRDAKTLAHFDRRTIDAANRYVALTGKAQCGVSVVRLAYDSIGVRQEPAALSAAMYVPENCAGPFPILAVAHGTQTIRRHRTSDIEADNREIAFFASQGYLVVATDYLGLGDSSYPYHPYLHADSEASAVIDSIRAARQFLRTRDVALSDAVMLLGYSQGGHAAMAAQREIERNHAAELRLVASAPLSGPYYLSQTFLGSWFGQTAGEENYLAAELFAYTVVSYSHIYEGVCALPV